MTSTETDLVFVGRRLTTKGTLAYFYVKHGDLDDHRGYKKPLVSGHSVGAIIRIHETDQGSYFTGGDKAPTAIGRFTDDHLLLRWSTEQESHVADHARTAESKRIAKAGDDPIRRQLDPIRDQLATMSSTRRAATIGWIITYLSTGQRR